MKTERAILASLALTAVLLSSGCSTTLTVTYQPVSTPIYNKAIPLPVAIREVSDRRGGNPHVYYDFNMDRGKFDKPVADIVRTALQTELVRAGGKVTPVGDKTNAPDIFVDCEVTDCRATITEKMFTADVLDLCLILKFKWTDAKTGKLLDANDRSEKRTRRLSFGGTPSLPFDAGLVRDFGNELVNDLLPTAIRNEIEGSRIFPNKP